MTKPNFCSQFDEALKHRVDETGTLSFTINSLYYLRRISCFRQSTTLLGFPMM